MATYEFSVNHSNITMCVGIGICFFIVLYWKRKPNLCNRINRCRSILPHNLRGSPRRNEIDLLMEFYYSGYYVFTTNKEKYCERSKIIRNLMFRHAFNYCPHQDQVRYEVLYFFRYKTRLNVDPNMTAHNLIDEVKLTHLRSHHMHVLYSYLIRKGKYVPAINPNWVTRPPVRILYIM